MHDHQLTPLGRRLLHSPLLREFCPRFARTRAEREQALRLVQANYSAAGLVPKQGRDLVYYRPLGLPQSRMAVAEDTAGRLIGTLSLVEDNALGLKLDHTYHREVAALRAQDRRLAELTCLAIRHETLRAATAVFFTLTRFLFQYAAWRRIDDLLMAIHPRHLAFYQRFFHVTQFGPRRSYEDVQGHPAVACRINVHTVTRDVDPELRQYYCHERYSPSEFEVPAMSRSDHIYFCRRAGLRLFDVDSSEARPA